MNTNIKETTTAVLITILPMQKHLTIWMKPVLHIQLILLLYNHLQFMADVNLHFILRSHLWSAMSEILLHSHMHNQLNVNMHSVIQVQFLRFIYCTLYFVSKSTHKHILPLALSLSVCRARRWTQCLCVWPVRLFPSCCPGRSRPQCAQPVSLPSGPRPASGCSVRSSPPAHPSAGQSQKTATKHKIIIPIRSYFENDFLYTKKNII